MDHSIRSKIAATSRKIEKRLAEYRSEPGAGEKPVLSTRGVRYEISDRVEAISSGGIGAIHALTRSIGLAKEIDRRLHLLKFHWPYHESDHVLNIAYNLLAGGTCLEHLEHRRNDEAYLNALGAKSIPDPTTAGDFCRRFTTEDVETLMRTYNVVRQRVWKQQPDSFFDEAILDADGTYVSTTGDCKEGMDISYKGTWGYHVLLVSLANTLEPMSIENRPGNRPSQEGAAKRLDEAAKVAIDAGFRRVTFRGDTDFSQTAYLDDWDDQGIEFVFGYDATANLVGLAESVSEADWKPLKRDPKYEVATKERAHPRNVKESIIRARGYVNLHLLGEEIAEFEYKPTKCKKPYRVVVVKKTISVEKGQEVLFPEVRYLFYITNKTELSTRDVVLFANDRCDQERLIGELKSGANILHAPVDNLTSNWAYMAMASLAWSLKTWFALLVPVSPRWKERHEDQKTKLLRMGFRSFLQAMINIPCQILSAGGKVVYRLLAWNSWQNVFFRMIDRLHVRIV